MHRNPYDARTALLRSQEAVAIQSIRLSLVLVILVAAVAAATPSASAGGCVNFGRTTDADHQAVLVTPSKDGVGGTVEGNGEIVTLVVLPAECQVPELATRMATQALSGLPDVPHVQLLP